MRDASPPITNQHHRPPCWQIGHPVGFRAVIARGDRAAVAIGNVMAFRTGFSFDAIARVLDGSAQEPYGRRLPLIGTSLTIQLQYSDGTTLCAVRRTSASLRADCIPTFKAEQLQAELLCSWWIDRLPPPGMVRVSCSWPAGKIEPTWTTFDPEELLSAASRSTDL